MASMQKAAQVMEVPVGSALQKSIQVSTNTDITQPTRVVTRWMPKLVVVSKIATRRSKSISPCQYFHQPTKASLLKSRSGDFTIAGSGRSSKSRSVQGAKKTSVLGSKALAERELETPPSISLNEEAGEKLKIFTTPIFDFFMQDDAQTSRGSASSPRKDQSSEEAAESSATYLVPVLTINANNIEEQLAELEANLEALLKQNQEKDAQIKQQSQQIDALHEKVIKKLSKDDSDGEKSNSEKSVKSGDSKKSTKSNSSKSLSVQQVQELIKSALKSQVSGNSHGGHYVKPYTKRIDSLEMPIAYQPQKFQLFDGKGNPKQHVAHFVSNSMGILLHLRLETLKYFYSSRGACVFEDLPM